MIVCRFPDQELLKAFGVLQLKAITLTPDEEVDANGNEVFEVLLHQYGQSKTHKWKAEREEKSTVTAPLVDPARAREEWSELKKTVKRERYTRFTLSELYQQIAAFHSKEFPNVIKLAKCALTLPVHTADVERTFSSQNLICTGLRNALTPAHQDMLMRVYLEGPKGGKDLDLWVVDVVDNWSAAKPRRIFQSQKVKSSN